MSRGFETISLPLESHALESGAFSRPLKAIGQDGKLVYAEPKSAELLYTEQLEQIWNEYPNGLLDMTEEGILDLVPEEVPSESRIDQDEDMAEVRDRSDIMGHDEMERLRSDIFMQLNDARNELWFVLELAKTLSASSAFSIDPPITPNQPMNKKPKPKPVTKAPENTFVQAAVEPPILPPGSYTVTPGVAPARPSHTQILQMQIALAAKHQALDECSILIDSAVEELQSMVEAGERFWGDVRNLKAGSGGQGRWAIVPKPEFVAKQQDSQKAKDIIIPYAVDEAPLPLRNRSLAAFDLDPKREDHLSFGSRTGLNLRVSLKTTLGAVYSETQPASDDDGVLSKMEAAQVEAFDEELFAEIAAEISRHPMGSTTARSAILKMGDESLIFELCAPGTGPSSGTTSPTCSLVLHSARLGLLQLYRYRKSRLILTSTSTSPSNPPSILRPLVQGIQYHSHFSSIKATLRKFSSAVTSAGLTAHVDTLHSSGDASGRDANAELLVDNSQIGRLGAVFLLQIEGCHGISVDTAAPVSARVTGSLTTFALTDLEDLPRWSAEELASQLLDYSHDALQKVEDEASSTFLDPLEGSLNLANGAILRVSVPAPYDAVRATCETSSGIGSYNSQSGQDLGAWIKQVAAA